MTTEARIVDTALGPMEMAESGDGPAVLVLHGTLGGWNQSMSLVRAIGPAGYRYVAVSRPGYLGTPLTLGKRPEAQADLCAALLDALDLDDACVMGLSGGGPTALQFALRHAPRTRGLLLVSTCAGKTVTMTLPFVVKLMAQLTRSPWLAEKLAANAARDPAKSMAMFIRDPEVLDRTLADPDMGPLLIEFMQDSVRRMYLRLDGTSNDIEVMGNTDHDLEQITAPTLVIHGTEDTMLSYADHAKVFEARIPGAELLTIEGGEHGAIFSHADEIRTAVAAFLRSTQDRDSSRAALA